MKVLIISRYIKKPSWQGSAQHVQTFASLLINNGHEVLIISGENVVLPKTFNQDNYKIIEIPLKHNSQKLESLVSASYQNDAHYKLCTEIIESFNPDIVHIGVMVQMGSFIDAAYDKKIPLVAMVHSYSWLCLEKFLINWKGEICTGPESLDKCSHCVLKQLSYKRQVFTTIYEKLMPTFLKKPQNKFNLKNKVDVSLEYLDNLRQKIDIYIAQSDATQEYLSSYGVKKRKIKLIRQWLTDEKLIKYQKKDPLSDNRKIRIGYIGNLHYVKGLHILSKALRMIKEKSKIELWILSSGCDADILDSFMGSTKNNFPEIKIYNDLQNGNTLQKMIAQLDFCVIPSICLETGPRVLLETIAQKVPSIISDSIGNKYLIKDNVNGFIFNSGDYVELSKLISKIICNKGLIKEFELKLPSVKGKDDWYKEIIKVHENLIETKYRRSKN